MPSPALDERTTRTVVGSLQVRAVEVEAEVPARGAACFLPGLSLTDYLLPTARALARRGLPCSVLDLPGLSRRDRVVPADPWDAGRLAAGWLRARRRRGPLVVLGHSTGAAAALACALALDAEVGLLVLAAPVFAPEHRRLGRLALAAPPAYRKESLRELGPTVRLAGNAGRVAAIVRSGMRVALEQHVAQVRAPLLLTAAEADSLSPGGWLGALAEAATASPRVVVERLPGSHNNVATHPDEVADTVVAALED